MGERTLDAGGTGGGAFPADPSGTGLPPGPLAAAANARRPSKQIGLLGAIARQRLALTGAVIVALFAILAVIGPSVAPHGPTQQFSKDRLQTPSRTYPFGTDEFGRDLLSRLLYGARISFKVGAIVVVVAGSIGVLFGLIAGYLGGWADTLISIVMDVVYAFPAVLLAIAIITALGNNLTNAILAISIVYMPPFVRIVRGSALTVRGTAYVEAARSIGASTPRILSRHVFPNITAPLIVQTSLSFAFAILSEAALAFLGLGNKPPAPSWGSMVSASYGFLQLSAWPAIVPGVAIALTVLGFNLLGDGLRDALDPRLRRL
ncbi:MAG: ABC transporter permease [Thermomicrobiales bacterium]